MKKFAIIISAALLVGVTYYVYFLRPGGLTDGRDYAIEGELFFDPNQSIRVKFKADPVDASEIARTLIRLERAPDRSHQGAAWLVCTSDEEKVSVGVTTQNVVIINDFCYELRDNRLKEILKRYWDKSQEAQNRPLDSSHEPSPNN